MPSWVRSWAADSATLLFSQAGAIVATSALAILLARYLGPKDWGIFSAVLGLSLALSTFVELGLTAWLLRELSQLWVRDEPEAEPRTARIQAGQLVLSSLAVNLALGAAMIVGSGAVAIASGAGATRALLLISLVAYGGLIAACSTLETVFRARRRVGRVMTATLLEKVLLLALVTVFLVLGFSMVTIGVAYLLAGIAHTAYDVTMIVRSKDVALVFPSKQMARHVARATVPFVLARTSLNVIPYLDTFILAAISAVAAGYFAIGVRALGPIIMIPAVMSTALFPFLARESEGSRAGWQVVGILSAVGAIIAAMAIVLSPPLVPIVFGAEYTPAIGVVQVMFLTIPFIFAGNALLAHVYSARLEQRALGLGLGGIACFGTGAIVAGQILVGPVGAAAGYLLRNILFTVALAVAGGARVPLTRSVSTRRTGNHRTGASEGPRETTPTPSPGGAK
jgi:O-antigen/teichoic acid export membrane protein